MDYTKVKPRFDEVLQNHCERLIGSRVGLRGLPLTLEAITALALLEERQEDSNDDPSKLHTKATLFQEMAEVGLESQDFIRESLGHLEEKGYFQTLDGGGLEPSSDVFTMVGALNKVFPQMPGMLLVAYFIQTVQEVTSGRKGLDHAVDQFDQALTMHGMSARKDKPAASAKPPEQDAAKKRLASLRKISAARAAAARRNEVASYSLDNFGAPTPVQKQEEASPPMEESPHAPPQEVPAPEAQEEAATPVVEAEETPPDVEDDVQPEVEEEQLPAEEDAAEKEASRDEEAPVEDEPPAELEAAAAEPEEAEAIEDVEPEPEPETEPEPEPEPEPSEPPEMNEADIMERVAQFEEALAMTCPLCGEGKVKEQQTSMGKIFFACTSKSCQFISWGKPHHIPCPLCSNSFLVEAQAIEGHAILKCPRATCSHVQPVSGGPGEAAPKKKKRRVVRRRKSKS
ncbi:topoisomerase DNA-binding C4 zinc finger domain-containing protein [Desulfatibacillum aliphaticivorans]|uniref:topoisomerase DNA-binding C4 zinc finger domain-containing protein n=1 Tax=Desulfatibacillum aliphaticivorans TaxID=218208 RepID=UPI0003F72AA7|nr:topoisomerase DNA-binding C4 zinc finger domain-containing protein [Desulfatibacillum aliphaticivorans]